jgi:DNA-binding PadR family transcriptional regulator
MPRSPRSNPLALAVLCCLFEKPMHPYEVAQTLRTRGKHESIRINYGSLYSVVDGLESRGMIEATATSREGRRPERTVYAITAAGTREMTDWLTEMIAVPAKEFTRFEAGLSLMPCLPPDEAVAALRQRAQALEVRRAAGRAELQAMGDWGLPRLFAIEGEYTVALLDAEIDFIDRLVKEIEAGSLSGVAEWQTWFRTGEWPTLPPEAGP